MLSDFEITRMILNHIAPELFTHNGKCIGIHGQVVMEFCGQKYGFFKVVESRVSNPYQPDAVKVFYYGFEMLEYLANYNPAIAAVLASPEVKDVLPTDD